jgi:hypothetical protein
MLSNKPFGLLSDVAALFGLLLVGGLLLLDTDVGDPFLGHVLVGDLVVNDIVHVRHGTKGVESLLNADNPLPCIEVVVLRELLANDRLLA